MKRTTIIVLFALALSACGAVSVADVKRAGCHVARPICALCDATSGDEQ